MADLSMLKRGVVTITSADVGTSKDVALPSPVKTGSSFLTATLSERRRTVFVQQGTIEITDADVGGTKDSAAFTAVDLTAAYVIAQLREKRTDDHRGATVKLQSTTTVRATFNPPAAGDTINVDFQVIDNRARHGATIRLLDEDTLRVEWGAQLVAGEEIVLAYEVVDADPIGDMLLELDFKEKQLLGELGSNQVQDKVLRDDVGNVYQYRVRTFTTKALAQAANKLLDDGQPLEAGEMRRRTVVVDIDIRRNDRKSLTSVVDDVMDTPGITVEE